MTNTELLLNANVGDVITITRDYFVLSDAAAYSVASAENSVEPKGKDKVKVFIDHETPCGSEVVAAQQKQLIEYAVKYGLELHNGYGTNYQIMLEKHVKPGQIVAHCGDFGSIYGAVNAAAVKLSVDEMCKALASGEVKMTVPEKTGLKLSGKLPANACAKDAVLTVLAALGNVNGKLLIVDGCELEGSERIAFFQQLSACGCLAALPGEAGENAVCFDLASVVPVVSRPEDILKVAPAAELSNIPVTAVFVGGCSAGRIEDIRTAAAVVNGKHVSRKVRATVAFASTDVYIQAANEGLINILFDAGVIVMNQGCSACYAHSQGLVDGKDTVLSAGSRVCPNSNGGGDAVTYLCSAATAVTSAIAGHVCAAEG